MIGLSVHLYSDIRWWSKWEVVVFGDIQLFLTGNIYLAPSTHSKVLSIVLDTTMKVSFELKMLMLVHH